MTSKLSLSSNNNNHHNTNHHHHNNNNNNNSIIITPVLRLFPSTITDYSNSNIPLSITITPFLLLLKSQSQQSHHHRTLLSTIPKCYHCGAPHSSHITYETLYNTSHHDNNNTSTSSGMQYYYCRLCNKTFQFYNHQSPPVVSMMVEGTSSTSRSSTSTSSCNSHNNNNNNYNHNDDNNNHDNNDPQQQQQQQQQERRALLQRHKTQKIRNTTSQKKLHSNNNNITTSSTHQQQQQQQQMNQSTTPSSLSSSTMEVTNVFDLPLRLPQSTTSTTSSSSTTTTLPLYRIPTLHSPIIWYICLDGGTIALQTPSYWKSVSQTIQHCLQTAPSHVHITILIASQQQQQQHETEHPKLLSIYDLHHPLTTIPKINTYSSNEFICNNNHDEEQQQQHNRIHTILLYHHTPVPYNNNTCCHYKYTINAALRSLVDYPNTTTCNNNNIYRCPIGWVTELLITAFQYNNNNNTTIQHVGYRPTTTTTFQNDSSSSNEAMTTTNQLLVYTGMKITFLLCDQPAGIGINTTTTTTSNKSSSNNNTVSTTTDTRIHHHPTHVPPIGERYTYRNNNNTNHHHRNAELTPSELQDYYYNDHSNSLSSSSSSSSSTNINGNKTNKNSSTKDKNLHTIVEYYTDLGRECSDMAIGIDLLLLYDSSSSCSSVDFALPLYQSLSEKSGAPGPVLIDLASTTTTTTATHSMTTTTTNTPINHTTTNNDDNTNNYNYNNNTANDISTTRLYREILSRTPWQPGRVFGAELRVRLSSGYMVDPNTVSMVSNVIGPQLAPIYNEAGCMGPACTVPESSQLWRMGTSDPYTSYTFDLAMIPHTIIRDHVIVDEGLVAAVNYDNNDTNTNNDGSVINLYPIIQICCAYTTVIAETDKESGIVSYYTVRQMRITNRMVPLAYSVEALYSSIDTEALAVVLFHRMALANYQDGIIAAATLIQQWLQCLLICIYKSAMEQYQIDEQKRQMGYGNRYITNHDYPYDKSHRYFYPEERLLFLEGELSAEDVLLAQGHERLRPIALMVYLLLQCDVFRCSSDYYCPSYDIRSAAISHLSSMTPTCLTRYIAPRIQLWESGHDVMEPIYDVLDLRSDAIQAAILECTSTSAIGSRTNTKGGKSASSPGLILFLDTPEQIVIMDARYVNNTNLRSGSSSDGRQQQQLSPSKRSSTTKNDEPLVVGIGLQNAIMDAASSYRVQPPIIYELNQSDTYGEGTLLRLVDHLIEDTYHIASQCENFNDWRVQMAQDVQIDVDSLYPQ